MNSPFPGMDPYLEHPALWPDVHNSLIAALRDELAQAVAHYTLPAVPPLAPSDATWATSLIDQ